jgi:putative ABC transport system permease protein
METFFKDLRFALRGLLHTPGFTAAAVIALALGIGATTAIFSVVHAVLLRSLGFGDESRVISVSAEQKGFGWKNGPISAPEVMDLRAVPFFAASGAFSRRSFALQGDRAERLEVGQVTSGFFEALDVRPLLGRTFTPAEDLQGNDGVALVTASAWHRRFGGDAAVVGRSVSLNGRPYQIVGVLPAQFSYAGQRDFYIPFGFTPPEITEQRGFRRLEVVARLRPGVTLAAAQKGLTELAQRLVQDHPNNYPKEFGWGLMVEPIRERFVSSTRDALLVLLGSVLLVLLIACANVANLLLARAARRSREFAVRLAIGASRGRIVRQLLTEGLVMAAVGATLGVVLAFWGLEGLLATAPRQIRELADVGLSAPVLGFSICLTVLTTLLFALVPALRASRVDLASGLKEGSRGTGGMGATRLRSFLVAAQVAISLVLLVGAGLMLRSFARLLDVSPGFETRGAMTAVLSPGGPAYENREERPTPEGDLKDAARRRYFRDGLRAAAELPGVEAAGAIDSLPNGGRRVSQTYFIEGQELRPGEPNPTDDMRRILPGYFAAMRQRLVAGRVFTDSDDERAGPVAIVNEAWGRRYFPGREVIGRRFRIDETDRNRWRTIVGVVADTHEAGLDKPAVPVFYLSALQDPPDRMVIVVRGPVTAGTLRDALSRVDPTQPLDRVQPLGEVVAASVASRRFPLQLLGAFAVLAVVLSALGIYGVTSYAVAQRTREIGLRMAVGASPVRVVRMVLGSSLRVVLFGICAGAAGALAGGRLLAAQLYGVSARDPLTFVAIAALLAVVALVASAVPALRAARIDPMAALRTE